MHMHMHRARRRRPSTLLPGPLPPVAVLPHRTCKSTGRCIYTEPELASVGETAASGGVEMVEYMVALRGNDRAILEGESTDGGFVLLRAEAATGRVLGGTVLAARAGEIINEISLAIKAGLSLESLGRNIHPYPTTSEAVMGCGLQWINARWRTMPERRD